MEFRVLVILFFCLVVLTATGSSFGQTDELPTIEGGVRQIYKDFEIEVVSLQRMPEYQEYFAGTDHPRGRRLVPPVNHEVVLAKLRTKRLAPTGGPLASLSVAGVDLISETRETFVGGRSRFIGGAITRFDDPVEIEYDFPVVVPLGHVFEFSQIRHSIQRESQPYIVIQKIRFAIGSLTQ